MRSTKRLSLVMFMLFLVVSGFSTATYAVEDVKDEIKIGQTEVRIVWQNRWGEAWRNPYGECWRSPQTIPLEEAIQNWDLYGQCYTLERQPEDVRVAETVYFVFDESFITGSAGTKIEGLVGAIPDDAEDIRFEIVAHADPMGSDEYNDALSERRAQETDAFLADVLAAEGIDARVTVDWRGENEPVVTDCEGLPREDEIVCNQENRRSNITLKYTTYVSAGIPQS